jgi:hypothetical protein
MHLFNSTEWCYIKRTTDNVWHICYKCLGEGLLLGKYPGNGGKANGKYDFAIKRTTDNVSHILLQASRWRVILRQIPRQWRKAEKN